MTAGIKSLRIAFMGTPDFAVPALRVLHEAGHEIVAVYSQPPRRAGRGKKLSPSPVQRVAEELGVEVRTPVSLKGEEDQTAFAALNLDAAIVAAYGLILPQAILDAPKMGCLNIHGSLLPRWRGAAPVQRAIMAGDAETGVCVMRMEQGLDTGPVLARLSTPIGADETAGELAERLARLGAPLVVETLRAMAAGRATATPQPEDGALYARKIDKAEARLDWREPAAALAARIRALTPAPGAWTMLGEERLKVLAAHPEPGEGPPGTVLDDALLVACGAGALRIDRAQRPGRAPTARADLLRGLTVAPGAVLT